MSDSSTSRGAVGSEELGEKHLTLTDAVAQSVGFMGPVFVVAFIIGLVVGAGPAGRGAGAATPVAIILAAIGVAALGWIISRYASRIAAAGSLYDYVTHGFGEQVGFVAGWAYYGGAVMLAAAVPVFVGGVTADFLSSTYNIHIPYWVLDLTYSGILFCLLYFGVRISTRVQLTLVVTSATVISVFLLSIIVRGGHGGNSLEPFKPSASVDGWSGIFYGVLYAILAFVGFEGAANLGEETAAPKRAIPRAIFLAIGIVGVYYVLASYAQAIGFGLDGKAWASNPAPLFSLAAPKSQGGFGSNVLLDFVQILVILDIIAVGLGTAVTATRGVFALARDRRIPGALAKVDRRWGTPVASTLFVVLVGVAFVLWVRLGHGVLSLQIPGAPPGTNFPEYFPLFAWMAGFGGFALTVVYATIALSGVKGLWPYENKAGLLVAGVVGFVVSAGAIFGSIYKVTGASAKIPLFAAGWIVLGIVVALVLNAQGKFRPALSLTREGAVSVPGLPERPPTSEL